jgi:hypothetical protein
MSGNLSDPAWIELEPDYVRKISSGSATEMAYTVEARMDGPTPETVGGQIFDNRWRRVKFEPAAGGVPAAPDYARRTLEHGMLGYAGAQALRWWLHAETYKLAGGAQWALETRLVRHKITSTYAIDAVAAVEPIDGVEE